MKLFFRSVYTTTFTLALLTLAIHLTPDLLNRALSHRVLGYLFFLLMTALALVGSDFMMRIAPGRRPKVRPDADPTEILTYRDQHPDCDGDVQAGDDIAFQNARFGDYVVDRSTRRVSIITQGAAIQIMAPGVDVQARYVPREKQSGSVRNFPF
jgi:hypothetical protein